MHIHKPNSFFVTFYIALDNNNNNKIIYSFKRKGDVSLIRRFKTPHKDEIKY